MKKWFNKRWFRRTLLIILIIIIAAIGWYYLRKQLRPSIPEPSESAKKHVRQVKILRDKLGVPHIYGKTDADTAFGLAYANAEDDFPLIQGTLAASRGKLATILPKKIGVINDYMVQLLQIPRKVDEQYETLISPEFKVILEAYAEGLNYYAFHHPEEVDSRLIPYRGKDVMAGFIHKLTLFIGVGAALEDLMGRGDETLEVGYLIEKVTAFRTIFPGDDKEVPLGSNSHAVSPLRSSDGISRLNVNSHQPWEGPVAWYEAHVVSEEGWNTIGGIFPGSPVILHGHNQYLGWAHTVNKPDAIDIYKLTMHPDGSLRYKFDGNWKDLIVNEGTITVDTGLFNLPVTLDFYESVHGPVLKLDQGYFAIRYAGHNRTGLSVEQWYRMNKARNIAEWKQAMAMQGIPMMNTMYADRNNILYVYYHLMPIRSEKYNWRAVLPGDTSQALWTEYLPFNELPMVENPPSGYLVNTNTTPYQATLGEGNPDPGTFSKTLGIETHMNNRALRSHELFGTDESITREEFLTYKFDQAYSRKSRLFRLVIGPLVNSYSPQTETEKKALQILKDWDGIVDFESVGASLANLIYQPIFKAKVTTPEQVKPLLEKAFKDALIFLEKHYGKIEVALGEVQRLRRGETDLPVAGSMDTLNAVHAKIVGDKMIGVAGDSYIMLVEFTDDGVQSWTRHQYGNINRKDSPHYDDQALDFTKQKLKKSLLSIESLRMNLESEYSPGDEVRSTETGK